MIYGALISVEIPGWLRQHFTTVPFDRAIEYLHGPGMDWTIEEHGWFYNIHDFFASYVESVLGDLSEYVTLYINEEKSLEECQFVVTYQGGSSFVRSDDVSSPEFSRAYHMIGSAEFSWLESKKADGFWMGSIPAPEA